MNTDPIPYISLAFGAAVAFLGGYAAWTIFGRRRLRALARALNIKDGG